jgi:hypothetical protein
MKKQKQKQTRDDKIQDEKNNNNNCTRQLTNVKYKLEGTVQIFEHTNKEKQNKESKYSMINKTNNKSI